MRKVSAYSLQKCAFAPDASNADIKRVCRLRKISRGCTEQRNQCLAGTGEDFGYNSASTISSVVLSA